MIRSIALLVLACVLVPSSASAHGIWGHIHVTGWAIENLPPGELRDFFEEPEVLNAALFGAAFTDSGYFPQSGPLSERSRAYSEHTHWEPFIESFIVWVVENDPPPWDNLESRMRVGFLIGCASHGLQDEIFDSLFLDHINHHDGAGQEEADPASDGFLALDEHLRWVPEPWVPMETLLELYAPLGRGIDENTIEGAVELMTFLYVREGGWIVAEGLGNQYADDIPWTREYYLDESIPGSLRAEINPTRSHQLALWERLHGRFNADDVVVATYPDLPRRLLTGDADDPGSTVTMIFGAGVNLSELSTELWNDDEGGPVAHRTVGTRWGAAFPRLIRFRPEESLQRGGYYAASLLAGATLINGATTTEDSVLNFQVECDPNQECEAIEVIDLAIEGPEPEPDPEPDADADAGPDVEAPDTAPDADVPDTAPDVPDANASPDVVPDSSGEDVSTRSASGGGCVQSKHSSTLWFSALLLVASRGPKRRLA